MKKFLCLLIFSTFFGSSFHIFTVGSITLNLFRILFLIFVFCHFALGWQNTDNPISKRYINILFMLIFFNLFTLFFTPSVSAWINGSIGYAINIFLIYFVYVYTETDKDLNNYILSFVSGLLMTMLISVYEYLTQNHVASDNYLNEYSTSSWQYDVLGRAPTAFLYNPNNIGFAVILGLCFGLYFTKLFKFVWIIFGAWSALCVYVSFATGSRGAIILVFLSIVLCVFFGTRALTKRLLIAFTAIVIGFILYNVFEDFIFKQLQSSGLLIADSLSDLSDGRFELIKGALKAAWDNKFVGTGPGTAELVLKGSYGFTVPSVHNFWAEFLLTEGIVPLIIFLVFYIRCIKVQFVLRYNDIKNTVILISLLMFSVAVFIPPTVITLNFIWLIFGFSLAAEKLYYDKSGIMI